jgi:hypothetical protein
VNTNQLNRLARHADAITGRQDDRLAEVHARIRRTRRRHTAGLVLGTGLLVLATMLAAAALRPFSDTSDPSPAPKPGRVDLDPPVSVRPLTWTDEFWPSRRINYGEQVIDTRLDLTKYDFATMDLTDGGVVLTTVDGRVWLADGTTVRRVAKTGVSSSFLGLLDVRTGNTGSLAAWTDTRAVVVYDTADRRVVARHRCGHSYCQILWVGADRVYVENRRGGERTLRVEVATGRVTVVSTREVARAMLNQPRALVVGRSFETGQVMPGLDLAFIRQGSRLRPLQVLDGGHDRLATAFDTAGNPVRLRVPADYGRARSFTLFQWIDDDRVAMMAGAGGTGFVPGIGPDLPEDDTGYGDILVCRLSSGDCRLAVPGPREYGDLTGDGAPDRLRIVPHYGTPGTN